MVDIVSRTAKADNLLMLSYSTSPVSQNLSSTVNVHESALVINCTHLCINGVSFPEPDGEHESTCNASIIIDDSTGKSSEFQTSAEKKDPNSSILNFKSLYIDGEQNTFLDSAMEELIQEMRCENISPTSASSTEDRKLCIEEQYIIVLWCQSQGTFIYDE
eukprot:2992648-Ditylum_brightwellii.AAC.1